MPPPNWLRSGAGVQEFGRAFVLAHLHVAVVGDDGDQPIVAHLMHVIGGGEDAGADLGDGFGVGVWSQV